MQPFKFSLLKISSPLNAWLWSSTGDGGLKKIGRNRVCWLLQCNVSRCLGKHSHPGLCHITYDLMQPLMCPSFQSERETGDRNYAIGYYLKEKKVSLRATLVLDQIVWSPWVRMRELASYLQRHDVFSCSASLITWTWWLRWTFTFRLDCLPKLVLFPLLKNKVNLWNFERWCTLFFHASLPGLLQPTLPPHTAGKISLG